MARVRRKIPDVYTRGRNPLNVAGNGRLAYAKAAADLSHYANMLLGRRRKILGTVRTGSIAGASGARTMARFAFRTGPAIRAIIIEMLCTPADATAGGSALADTPFFVATATPGAGPVTTSTVYVNKRIATTPAPDDFFITTIRLEPIVPSSTYMLTIGTDNNARAQSVTVYEETDNWLPVRSKTADRTQPGANQLLATTGSLMSLNAENGGFDRRSHVGSYVTLTGFPEGGPTVNNGTFRIVEVVDDWELYYINPLGGTTGDDADSRYEIDDLTCRTPGAMKTILAEEMSDINSTLYSMWKDGAGHLFSWSAPTALSSGSSAIAYANIHDTSFTAYDATAPGNWVWPEKRGSYESPLVPCVFWAWADLSAGVLTARVQARNSGGTLGDLAITSTTPALYTVTCLLDSSLTEDKIDILGNGNLTGFARVYAYGMYQLGT